jgi:hypothetical protein
VGAKMPNLCCVIDCVLDQLIFPSWLFDNSWSFFFLLSCANRFWVKSKFKSMQWSCCSQMHPASLQ